MDQGNRAKDILWGHAKKELTWKRVRVECKESGTWLGGVGEIVCLRGEKKGRNEMKRQRRKISAANIREEKKDETSGRNLASEPQDRTKDRS